MPLRFELKSDHYLSAKHILLGGGGEEGVGGEGVGWRGGGAFKAVILRFFNNFINCAEN